MVNKAYPHNVPQIHVGRLLTFIRENQRDNFPNPVTYT